jgi:hypothetical protein
MTKDLAVELEEDLAQFSSGYRVSVSESVKGLLEEWDLDQEDPTRIRVEERVLPIIEGSLTQLVAELERALRPLTS